MLGTTLTFKLDGTGGTPVVLNRISDDGMSARYYKNNTTEKYQFDVSHVIDRNNISKHYLEFKQTVPETALQKGYTTSVGVNFKANDDLVSPAVQKAIVTALMDFVGSTSATAGKVDELIGLNS